MPLQNLRLIQDALLQTSNALPDNAATVRTAGIDLQAARPFPATERITVQIVTTAGNAANNNNINVRLQHANNNANANFVNIPELAIVSIFNAAGSYPATAANFALPPSTLRFIRAIATMEAGGGNATNGTLVVRVNF